MQKKLLWSSGIFYFFDDDYYDVMTIKMSIPRPIFKMEDSDFVR